MCCTWNIPGMPFEAEESELNLTYHERFEDIDLPDAYERLILDFILKNQTNFVRTSVTISLAYSRTINFLYS